MSKNGSPNDAADSLAAYVESLEEWLGASPAVLRAAVEPRPRFADRVVAMTDLMRALYDSGFSRYGWPEEFGGLGGTVWHRAALWETLARHGVSGMALFEHFETLLPALVALGPKKFLETAVPAYLSAKELWAQGFSEPEAGSDLASLRTRATPVEGGYVLRGRKVWTSWASYSTWCLVLARTGTTESRHRGITAFIVDLGDPAVEVTAIEQANGTDGLAELALDDVFVPADRIVGEVDGGWAVAMHVLSWERGTLGWYRHGFMYRSILAWARTDLAAIHDVSRQAVSLDLSAPPRFDEIAKAIAGRNAPRVCERALQVLGGIGFTAEQGHHHFHSRALALDGLLGASAELARGLGTWLREGRTDPRIPYTMLHGRLHGGLHRGSQP